MVSNDLVFSEDSRSQASSATGGSSHDLPRSVASRHVDQEEELASTVELVEASSSRELCVATVTLFPLLARAGVVDW